MKIKRIAKIVLIILVAIFLIIGVPIIINECYKANFGYSTVWNGADALGHYGAILGSVIAVVTLAKDKNYNVGVHKITVWENNEPKLVEKYPVGQYPLKELKENGLTSVQGRSKATVQLMKYLEK